LGELLLTETGSMRNASASFLVSMSGDAAER